MRLKSFLLSALTNFLLGVAWAVAFVSALTAIFDNYHFGFFHAAISAFIWALPGLFLVVIIEYILAGFDRLEESKKQTILLEQLLKTKETDKED